MSGKRHRDRRTCLLRDALRSWVFLFLIGLPLISLIFQRDLAITAFPVPRTFADVLKLPTEFKSYFAASLNLRGALAGWHNRVKSRVNGPLRTGKIIVGKNGWLFLKWMVFSRDHERPDPLSPAALADWQRRLESNQRECTKLGIPYLVVLIPSKQAVYPEHLPDSLYEKLGEGSGVAQLDGYLKTNATEIHAVELLTDLRSAKAGHNLYYKTDTHWNSLGGLVGANTVRARLHEWFPGISPTAVGTLRIDAVDARGGNEARLLGRAAGLRETDLKIGYPDRRTVTDADGGPMDLPLLDVRQLGVELTTRSRSAPVASGVIFHNSFGYAMVEHLGREFRTAHWFWSDFSSAQVKTHRPDVVIHLLTF